MSAIPLSSSTLGSDRFGRTMIAWPGNRACSRKRSVGSSSLLVVVWAKLVSMQSRWTSSFMSEFFVDEGEDLDPAGSMNA